MVGPSTQVRGIALTRGTVQIVERFKGPIIFLKQRKEKEKDFLKHVDEFAPLSYL